MEGHFSSGNDNTDIRTFQHTAFDGITSITCMNYAYGAISENHGEWVGNTPERELPPTEQLRFDLDAKIKKKIKSLSKEIEANVCDFNLCMVIKKDLSIIFLYGQILFSAEKNGNISQDFRQLWQNRNSEV